MEVLDSAIPPATAAADRNYIVAFIDDDWDHWASPNEVTTYRGRRTPSGRWRIAALDGTPVDWDYADDELVVLREAQEESR